MRRDASAALALAALVAGLWCVVVGRTSLEAWRVPVDTGADAWYTLATLKAAHDGHLTPLGLLEVPELGAPHGASWNDFLRQHKLQYGLAGGLARTVGLFPAANLLVLLAAVLAALSFQAVSRHLGARPEWAFAGACAFALSPFLFHRSLAHLTLSFYWPIPLAILVVAWAFEEHGIRPGSRRFLAAAAIAVVTGLHNIYFAALLAQFLGLSFLVQGLVRRAPRAALSSLALLVVLLATVLADNANLLVQAAREGAPADALLRPYGNLERYALKPIELLLPLGEAGIVPWRAAGKVYLQSALYRGELGSAYLGLAGVLALLGLAIATARAGLGRPRRPVPGAALALAWIFAYAVVGGLNGLLGLAGFVWLRATNRTSIWILAVVLLWGATAISRAAWTRRRSGERSRRGAPRGPHARRPAPAADAAGGDPGARRRSRLRRRLHPFAGGRAPRGGDALPAPGRGLPRGAAHPGGERLRAPPPVPALEAAALQLRLRQGPAARGVAAARGGAGAGGDGGRARAHGLRGPPRDPEGLRGRGPGAA